MGLALDLVDAPDLESAALPDRARRCRGDDAECRLRPRPRPPPLLLEPNPEPVHGHCRAAVARDHAATYGSAPDCAVIRARAPRGPAPSKNKPRSRLGERQDRWFAGPSGTLRYRPRHRGGRARSSNRRTFETWRPSLTIAAVSAAASPGRALPRRASPASPPAFPWSSEGRPRRGAGCPRGNARHDLHRIARADA